MSNATAAGACLFSTGGVSGEPDRTGEDVACPLNRLQRQRRLAFGLDFASQAADSDVERAPVALDGIVSKNFQHMRARDDLAATYGEQFQELGLLPRQGDLPSRRRSQAEQPAIDVPNRHRFRLDVTKLAFASACQRLDRCRKFLAVDRLDQVEIRACVIPLDAIFHRAPYRHEDDRDAGVFGEMAADGQAIVVRQVDVNEGDVIGVQRIQLIQFDCAADPGYVFASGNQIVSEAFAQFGVVLDDNNPVHFVRP